jgi:hypothetical protein
MPPSFVPTVPTETVPTEVVGPQVRVADLATAAGTGLALIALAAPASRRLQLRPGRWPGTVVFRVVPPH